jgi:hypothetical protein
LKSKGSGDVGIAVASLNPAKLTTTLSIPWNRSTGRGVITDDPKDASLLRRGL